ncbi:MAG: SDR family oxidoreductase [Acutalibacteraceae bacterium]|jgi:NAD(P)-dependent dehydrogenase (short-subunit alcohol dehydrogenase family)
MKYAGKRYIITGASGGMGRVLVKKLAEDGAKLAICSNDANGLDEVEKELAALGNPALVSKCIDITNEKDVAEFFGAAKGAFGGEADGLINLAGLSIPGKIAETPEADYDTTIDVNLKGTFLSSKHFLPMAAENAQIINIGSMAALRANGNAPLYCTAKAAVNMFSNALQIQATEKGVRVTVLNPGGADTPFWGNRPVNRAKLLQAADVVEVILFVLSLAPNIAVHSIDFESFEAMK